MEESVAKKTVHEESSNVTAVCCTVDTCLSIVNILMLLFREAARVTSVAMHMYRQLIKNVVLF